MKLGLTAAGTFKQAGQAGFDGRFPSPDLSGVDFVSSSQLGCRLLSFEGFEADFGFEFRAVISSLFSHLVLLVGSTGTEFHI